jgi:hypothetical protein
VKATSRTLIPPCPLFAGEEFLLEGGQARAFLRRASFVGAVYRCSLELAVTRRASSGKTPSEHYSNKQPQPMCHPWDMDWPTQNVTRPHLAEFADISQQQAINQEIPHF